MKKDLSSGLSRTKLGLFRLTFIFHLFVFSSSEPLWRWKEATLISKPRELLPLCSACFSITWKERKYHTGGVTFTLLNFNDFPPLSLSFLAAAGKRQVSRLLTADSTGTQSTSTSEMSGADQPVVLVSWESSLCSLSVGSVKCLDEFWLVLMTQVSQFGVENGERTLMMMNDEMERERRRVHEKSMKNKVTNKTLLILSIPFTDFLPLRQGRKDQVEREGWK